MPGGLLTALSQLYSGSSGLILYFFIFLLFIGGDNTITDVPLQSELFCHQTEGTLKSNSPCRYVRGALEVPAFHGKQRQRRVGVLHIPALWLIHRSKNHLVFKVPCWLHLNVKCIKSTWKKGQVVHFQPPIFKTPRHWLCWESGEGVKQPHRWWKRCFPSWLILLYSSWLACSNLLFLPTTANQLVAVFWSWGVW